jgi:N-acetylglucosaminyl-diphospho-decaprenol L-rhamnosyltransferase
VKRDLAVLIVTWNVRDLIVTALKSLLDDLATSGLEASVHVVDCASSDGTADAVARAFPEVDLVASNQNLGFAGGNNLLLRRIGFEGSPDSANLPRAVYLLNPDTETKAGATRALFDALMADKRRGFVGARLSHGDGSFQHSAFHFPGLRQLWVEFFPTPGRLIESRFNGRYARHLYDNTEPFEVDCVLGATVMLRRESILATGLFDEQFFMYCEEIDWEWRIHKAGYRAACVPNAQVVHYVGQSTGQVRPRSIVNLWTSRLRLYGKHYPPWKRRIARRMMAVGIARLARNASDPEVKEAYQTVRQLAMKAD